MNVLTRCICISFFLLLSVSSKANEPVHSLPFHYSGLMGTVVEATIDGKGPFYLGIEPGWSLSLGMDQDDAAEVGLIKKPAGESYKVCVGSFCKSTSNAFLGYWPRRGRTINDLPKHIPFMHGKIGARLFNGFYFKVDYLGSKVELFSTLGKDLQSKELIKIPFIDKTGTAEAHCSMTPSSELKTGKSNSPCNINATSPGTIGLQKLWQKGGPKKEKIAPYLWMDDNTGFYHQGYLQTAKSFYFGEIEVKNFISGNFLPTWDILHLLEEAGRMSWSVGSISFLDYDFVYDQKEFQFLLFPGTQKKELREFYFKGYGFVPGLQEEDRCKILHIFPGSDVWKKRVAVDGVNYRIGNQSEIVSMNGIPCKEYPLRRNGILAFRDEGDTLRLGIKKGSRVVEFDIKQEMLF